MTCDDCQFARESPGHCLFNPACIYCGARLIQAIGRLAIPIESAKKRRKAVLADWTAYGHDEKEIRDLVKGPRALEPETKGKQKNADR